MKNKTLNILVKQFLSAVAPLAISGFLVSCSATREASISIASNGPQSPDMSLTSLASDFKEVASFPVGGLVAKSNGYAVSIGGKAISSPILLNREIGRPLSFDFAPDGKSLLIGSYDGSVYRWKFFKEQAATTIIDRDRSFERYNGHSAPVSVVRYHPNGLLFLSGDWQGVISVWRPYDADEFEGRYQKNAFIGRFFAVKPARQSLRQDEVSGIEHIILGNDNERIYVTLQNGTISIWDLRGLIQRAVLKNAHKGSINALVVNEGEDMIATSGRDGKVKVWSIKEEPYSPDVPSRYSLTLEKEMENSELKSSLTSLLHKRLPHG